MPGKKLGLSLNGKTGQIVEPRVYRGRSFFVAKIPNSFGITSKESCPGKTQFCEDYCYAVASEGRTNVEIAMRSNYDLLLDSDKQGKISLLREMIEDYKAEVVKKNIKPEENVFRIHWDGDFFSVEYAEAWAEVIKDNPEINFWVYTRSFGEPVNVVPILFGIPNLNFYLSVDEGNIEDAIKIKDKYPKISMAFCAKDQYSAEQLAHRVGKKHLFPCPENKGDIPLALKGHGACIECTMCYKSRPNILFFNSKVYDLDAQQRLFEEAVPVTIRPPRRKAEEVAEDVTGIFMEELVLF